MKRLTTITTLLFSVLVTGCSYGSKYEAEMACYAYEEEYTVKNPDSNNGCWDEDFTRQWMFRDGGRVVKRFRY